MLTFAESVQRTLSTPDEIAAYLKDKFDQATADSPFAFGEPVSITSRAGLVPEIAVGDVGIMLCDLPHQPFSWVMVLTSGGVAMPVQIQTTNLTKRGAPEAAA
ncbi:hypothetical protein MMB17_18590 [Methylobacterium organophilum]|uniref:hypothetical protein n=1 Tax=Methylobacterium organophilum TaxID=410 RepID=UPI001F1343B1|nr:hypothetical protein [Methylobacterium organophilum]UMY16671.1 hypothetical protein MMB17_18590 [Methylobacterium organophilum]